MKTWKQLEHEIIEVIEAADVLVEAAKAIVTRHAVMCQCDLCRAHDRAIAAIEAIRDGMIDVMKS